MRWIPLIVVAGCAQASKPAEVGFQRRVTVTRSAPERFLGIAGMTSLTESTDSKDFWGSGSYSRLIVSRGDTVVCGIPFGQSGSHESHSFRQTATLELASQTPLRFAVRRDSDSNDLGSQTSCTGFELPPSGECRQVFERQCSNEFCTPNVKVSPTCGSGTLKGRITYAQEPIVAATLTVGQHWALTDDHGEFAIEAGPGTHVLQIDWGYDAQRATVTVGEHEDVEVRIDIHCTQVIDPLCCTFLDAQSQAIGDRRGS